MIHEIVYWALGPAGRRILQWYIDHNLLINGPIVLIALLGILFPQQRRRLQQFLRDLWLKLPFKASEEGDGSDQQANKRSQVTANNDRDSDQH
jgi:hypothetical protein